MPENSRRTYIAIDLKSFYASVECRERGLDPLTTNLVVADSSRTEKTICLAVSPSMKAYGIGGRARLFEVVRRMKEVNAERRKNAPGHVLKGKSSSGTELRLHPEMEAGFITAPPRMAFYIEYSARIYGIYLKYIAREDIHVYSIDEVMMDVTSYLRSYRMSAGELARKIILDILGETGITATAGIGTNLYLCKVAMDIMAKHIPEDRYGVRIAELDEMSYRRHLWTHRPLTDFWRVGRGTADRLEKIGVRTMGDIARLSVNNEEALYKMFGVNAELLIDHAWGWEPCTMDMIKAYKPENNSFSHGQVLQEAYSPAKARVVVMEMAEAAALGLLDKKMVTDQIVLTVGYDTESLRDPEMRKRYEGDTVTDRYGRQVPKHAHGTANLDGFTSSARAITDAVAALYDRIVNPDLLVRRIYLVTNHVIGEEKAEAMKTPVQYGLFDDVAGRERERELKEAGIAKERKMQEAVLKIKKQFGKNAILRGLDFEDGATARMRNSQIGGHKA